MPEETKLPAGREVTVMFSCRRNIVQLNTNQQST